MTGELMAYEDPRQAGIHALVLNKCCFLHGVKHRQGRERR